MFIRIHKIIESIFSNRTPATVCALSFLMLTVLCYVDYITGDYSLIVFYLIPVSLTAWFVNSAAGIIFCILTLAARVIADEAAASVLFNHATLYYWNQAIEFIFLIIMSQLFSALKTTLEAEKSRARIDPLTNAYNRRSFYDLAEYELNRSRRYQHPFTVAYIDIDNFKNINDHHGHHTGDTLLEQVVGTIRSNVRNTDILARFGGDEFVLLLPETPGDAAIMFLEKIHAHLNNDMKHKNWPVSFSIGAVTYQHAPENIDEVIHKADELMYTVKRSGKNRLVHTYIQENSHG